MYFVLHNVFLGKNRYKKVCTAVLIRDSSHTFGWGIQSLKYLPTRQRTSENILCAKLATAGAE